MAIVVEHEKRKREILEKSLELFCQEGYEDVTFQKIADTCGITRTTLYIYFKNKREIFLFSIKQLTTKFEKSLIKAVKDDSLNAESCLRKIMASIIDACIENKRLFVVLLPYLMALQKSGVDPNERVQRRILRLRHVLTTIIIRGQEAGEFKKQPVKTINDLIYSIVESGIFRIAVLNQTDVSDIHEIMNKAIDGILTDKQ